MLCRHRPRSSQAPRGGLRRRAAALYSHPAPPELKKRGGPRVRVSDRANATVIYTTALALVFGWSRAEVEDLDSPKSSAVVSREYSSMSSTFLFSSFCCSAPPQGQQAHGWVQAEELLLFTAELAAVDKAQKLSSSFQTVCGRHTRATDAIKRKQANERRGKRKGLGKRARARMKRAPQTDSRYSRNRGSRCSSR